MNRGRDDDDDVRIIYIFINKLNFESHTHANVTINAIARRTLPGHIRDCHANAFHTQSIRRRSHRRFVVINDEFIINVKFESRCVLWWRRQNRSQKKMMLRKRRRTVSGQKKTKCFDTNVCSPYGASEYSYLVVFALKRVILSVIYFPWNVWRSSKRGISDVRVLSHLLN